MKIVKAFNPGQLPAARYLAAAALAVSLAGVSAPASAVMIDDFSVNQARITDSAPPNGLAASSTAAGAAANLIGGNRYMSVELTTGVLGQDGYAEVIGGTYSNSYSTTAEGISRIVWSGAANATSLALNANLCAGSKFNVSFLTNDHPLSYTMNVYAAGGKSASLTKAAGVFPPATIIDFAFASFVPAGGWVAADWCNVGRIEMIWNTDTQNQPALDLSLDQIEVPNDIAYQSTTRPSMVCPPTSSRPAPCFPRT